MEREEFEDDAAFLSRRFGKLIRQGRREMGMSQEDLATVSGVGIRFVHDLERGKPTCQIGRALVVAGLVGLNPVSLLEQDTANNAPR